LESGIKVRAVTIPNQKVFLSSRVFAKTYIFIELLEAAVSRVDEAYVLAERTCGVIVLGSSDIEACVFIDRDGLGGKTGRNTLGDDHQPRDTGKNGCGNPVDQEKGATAGAEPALAKGPFDEKPGEGSGYKYRE
jgi:hypothetical protein